jgi:CubicO group peptidase (beta-lactamase class C family)
MKRVTHFSIVSLVAAFALLQTDTCTPRPNTRLAVLELRIGSATGEDAIKGFDPNHIAYQAQLPALEDTFTLRAQAQNPSATVEVRHDGQVVPFTFDSYALLDVPMGKGELKIRVTVDDYFWTYTVGIMRRAQLYELEQFADDYVAEHLDDFDGPGVAIGLMGPEGVLFEKSYGMANIEESIPIASNTPFNLASVSKQFTATAVMILYEEGSVHPDDLVADYFPEAPLSWIDGGMTVHHLLTHQSGIPDHLSDGPGWGSNWSNLQVLAWAVITPLEFTPGARYEYSNTGYVLLAMLVERLSGQPFETFLSERIFGPLEMAQSSVPRTWPADIPGRAISYRDNEPFERPLRTVGDQGQYSSLDDLEAWEFSLRNFTVVEEEALDLMFTRYVDTDYPSYFFGLDCSYGYGWTICDFENEPVNISHTGWIWGFLTAISRAPTKDVAVIMLSNGNFLDDWVFYLTNDLYRFYLGLDPVTATKTQTTRRDCPNGRTAPPILTPRGVIWSCD